MPYSVSWYIKDEIIYTHYSGVTTAEEMHECLLKVKAFIESSPRSLVHNITDVGDITESVPIKDSVRLVREIGPHARSGWSIVLREKSPIIKMGSAMATSIFRMRYKTFDTMEQAIAHLKFFDQTINWESADESVVKRIKV